MPFIFINFLLIATNYAADRNFCENYAKEAQKAVNNNKQYQCGFTGLRWSEDIEGQKQWCLTIRQDIAINETRVRTKKIRECLAQHINKKKDQTATKAPVLIAKRYVDNKDGTITDTKTNLMWKKCPEGLSGKFCKWGKEIMLLDNDANNYAQKHKFAGYADWRLPTKDELISLIYCSNGKTHITQENLRKNAEYEGNCYKEQIGTEVVPCDSHLGCGTIKPAFIYNNPIQQPAINLYVFPNTQKRFYWTSSSSRVVGWKWYIDFTSGGHGTHSSGSNSR